MNRINITMGDGTTINPAAGTLIQELVPKEKSGVLGAVLNNSITELTDHVYEDSGLSFLDITARHGHMIYQRSAALLMVYAVKTVFGAAADVVIKHSVNKNLSCEVIGVDESALFADWVQCIEDTMREAAAKDLPIHRERMSLSQAESILSASGDTVTLNTLRFMRSGSVRMYKLDEYWVLLYGAVVPSAGYIKDFKLIPDDDGFLLHIPNPSSAMPLLDVTGLRKIRGVYKESSEWGKLMGVENVGALNATVCDMRGRDIILVNEALHEKRIAGIADQIHQNKKSVVLVAGPSSSGKTTFSNRLCVQLAVLGMDPRIISLDDYFLNRNVVPIDEFGKPDFESFDFLDREQLNIDLIKLLNGETVEMPDYNFHNGEREYKGREMKLKENSVLVLEGIHGLNDALTDRIPANAKYKVFISAMTQINLDRHNRIPTSDTRLIRRIVRDMRTRGNNAVRTLSMWESVSRGEEKNIFPYQETVDVVFNSALIYEMCILKQFAEPLLFGIDNCDPCKADARRLLRQLDSFVSLPPDEVPVNSILREFIGGSCYKV